MNMPDDNKSIYAQLLQLMFINKHRMIQIAEKFDLTMMQSTSLLMLGDGNPKAMRTLSDYFMCDASTVTGLIDRLEARSLVERINHPTDRRVKLLKLTDEGTQIRDAIRTENQTAETERLNKLLSIEERMELKRMVRILLNNQEPIQ
jgi:DNA-binding MarR family transcriptional regulator